MKLLAGSVLTFFVFLLQLSAQSPEINQSKYWFYRYRMNSEFLKKGINMNCPTDAVGDGGYSIPANAAYEDNLDLNFGDGSGHVGYYMAILAMEYKLLQFHGGTAEQLNRTKPYRCSFS